MDDTKTQPEAQPAAEMRPASQWRDSIAASVRHRDELAKDWKENVSYRVMKMFTDVNTDKVAVPEDWARTKQKVSQLSFQVPKIVATARQPQYQAAAPIFQAVLNHKLHHEVRAEVMLDECLADVVNAAGLMASMVGIDIVTEDVEVPEQDISQFPPEVQAALMKSGQVPTITMPQTVHQQLTWKRISPGALLWPAEFTSSDWDDAPWLGYETWMLLAHAKKTYKKLPPDFKSSSTKPQLLSEGATVNDAIKQSPEKYVKVQVIIYKAYMFDADATHPEHLRRLIFVEGHDEPVEQGDLPWQQWVEKTVKPAPVDPKTGQPTGEPVEVPGHFIGVRKNPIRVATLTYVSDLATPPSDSQAGRSQVNELIRSRSQMIRQRDSSIPMRWADTNRIDAEILEQVRAGEWNGVIPINGPGERAIGEVSRAQYPRENFSFQNVLGQDLDRAWSLSSTQLASQGGEVRSATETKLIQSAADVRLEYEKARVARYVIGGVEVLAGLVQLFTDHTEYVQIVGADGAKRMEAWDRHTVDGEYAFDVVPDSADRIDPTVRQERILRLYNLAANDPTINREALTRQLVESYGMDPSVVMKAPPPPKDEPPNISFRFGGDDMTNPLAVAVMLKAYPDLSDKHIMAAAKMIQDAIQQIQTPHPPAPPQPGGGAPPAGAPPAQPPITPPETQEPILKRLSNGARMAA